MKAACRLIWKCPTARPARPWLSWKPVRVSVARTPRICSRVWAFDADDDTGGGFQARCEARQEAPQGHGQAARATAPAGRTTALAGGLPRPRADRRLGGLP